jgi:ATP adenylyltransferase
MEYIKKSKEDDECFICDVIKANQSKDKENLVIYRGKNAIVILNKYPYIGGHLLVAPKKHTSNLNDLQINTKRECWMLMEKSVELLKKAITPNGFNVGMNLGIAAGAGLESHLHIHIVPRWVGDSNFMPILGKTRIINQELNETMEVLLEHKDIFDED